MTTEDLDYSMALVGKAAAGFERIDASFGGSSVHEMPSNSITRSRDTVCERKSQSMWLVFLAIKYLLIQVCTCKHNAAAGVIN